jgi:hypothetical protein
LRPFRCLTHFFSNIVSSSGFVLLTQFMGASSEQQVNPKPKIKLKLAESAF